TGLLCEPGDSDDLAAKLATLLDDRGLRERMGRAGRVRFEEHYAWPVIVERHYRPLLSRRSSDPAGAVRLARPYAPHIPERVDRGRLLTDAAGFFRMPHGEVEAAWRDYRTLHERRGYARTLGEYKTLCLEEAFLLYLALMRFRPNVV